LVARAGFPWRDPREALRETTATVRSVLAGQGLPGLRTPRPAAHAVPVPWAARALETCEAAGRHADGLMLYLCTTERYRRATARMRRGADASGRDPAAIAVSVLIPTFIHPNLATARQAAREFLVHYAGMPHYATTCAASGFAGEMDGVRKALSAGSPSGALSALSDSLLDEVLLVGPAARCREQLDAFRKAGVEWATLGPQRVGDEDLVQQAHLLMRELAPR
jgi:alkanesulfonate monooxygenase SsuD/methylene tetrahydromethanopterin reductase-like flavin-dependent oxidoreductase (luciferase family)